MDTKQQQSRFSGTYAEKLLNEFLNLPEHLYGRRISKKIYRETIGYQYERKFAHEVLDKLVEYVNTHPELGVVKMFPRKRSVVLILNEKVIAILSRDIIVRKKVD